MLSLSSQLLEGENELTFRSTNYLHDEETGRERHARLDRIDIRDGASTIVHSIELENLEFGGQ